MIPCYRFACRSMPAFGLVLAVLGAAVAAEKPAIDPLKPASGLIHYQPPGSKDSFFALSLKPGRLDAVATPRDHVILVDTSASQAGSIRETGLAALDGFVAALSPKDRLQIYAVDVGATPLTSRFVAADSPDLTAALQKLRKRIPLGTTNLYPALEAAALDFGNRRGGSILYIGDGMSLGKAIPVATVRTYLARLRDQETAFHSFAIGPKTDLQLLGVLAEQSGGVVVVDELRDDRKTSATRVGRQLAAAATAPVFYPTKFSAAPGLSHLQPGIAPPLRADRETVWLGKGTLPKSVKVTISGKCSGKEQVITWTVQSSPAQAGNTFLGGLWLQAEREKGLLVPVAGNELLNYARQAFEDQLRLLAATGRGALATRDLKRAEEIAWNLRQADPGNADAAALLHASERMKSTAAGKLLALLEGKAAPDPGDAPTAEAPADPEKPAAEPAKDDAPEPADDDKPAPAAKPKATKAEADDDDKPTTEPKDAPATDAEEKTVEEMDEDKAPAAAKPAPQREVAPRVGKGLDDTDAEEPAGATAAEREALIQHEEELRKVRAEALGREVQKVLDGTRRISRDDPDAAISELKRILTSVEASIDIDANIREQMRARLHRALLAVASNKDAVELQRIQSAERQAQMQAQRNLIDQLGQRDAKLQQLIDRVRSLLTEGFLGNADAFEEGESVARAAWELAPYSGATAAAIFDAEAAGQLDKANRLRSERADKFLATLHQVELAHVPFPDEPPVLWPQPEVWQALTERRKKWASVDLVKYNKTEEKIRQSLDKQTDVDFNETPLKDALQFLKDLHNINIFLDETAISDEGIQTDTPITLQLSGISFRSVLKLMLEPLQLTYVIDDEVMKITTTVKAGEKLYTRVYPVGDLVIPLMNPMMMSMGMMGGGMMGMSGMMGNGMGGGGMMGGMGGGGMGMGGMGGMGMGGMGMGMM